MEKFIYQIRNIYNISDQAMELLLSIFTEIKQKKGTIIVREGESNNDIIFLKKGFSRAYINQDGKETTVWFASSGSPTGAYHGTQSTINVELLEDSILLITSRYQLEALFEENIELANWGRKIAEYYLEINVYHFSHYNGLEGKEKYELLLKEYPEIFQKAAIKHIASFLNITPQSLSRIRGSL
ncbi:Crp/Fnr family transcriptional regulator [Dysgonomonas massiliensis]|uniref:Crp/Fnr family transcriptional regulator n=1 Tax=Dysgonomonas massiliensis TaxID=2040292 RepID=UPI000C77E570|nr:Crp/Fnr family transcriptional regulator [Dysgonomonas massiliensis]